MLNFRDNFKNFVDKVSMGLSVGEKKSNPNLSHCQYFDESASKGLFEVRGSSR